MAVLTFLFQMDHPVYLLVFFYLCRCQIWVPVLLVPISSIVFCILPSSSYSPKFFDNFIICHLRFLIPKICNLLFFIFSFPVNILYHCCHLLFVFSFRLFPLFISNVFITAFLSFTFLITFFLSIISIHWFLFFLACFFVDCLFICYVVLCPTYLFEFILFSLTLPSSIRFLKNLSVL